MGNCCSNTADPVDDGEVTLQEQVTPVVPPVVVEVPGPSSQQQGGRKPPRESPQVGGASSYDRPRVKSAPQKVRPMNDREPPPLPSQRSRSKSHVASSGGSPSSDHRQTSAEHPRASPRRPTMSYPARRPLNSTVRQVLPEHFKFRVLVVGKSGSGKSSLIKAVFKVDVTVRFHMSVFLRHLCNRAMDTRRHQRERLGKPTSTSSFDQKITVTSLSMSVPV